MEPGFSRGQSNNLPKVDVFMSAEYFINHANFSSGTQEQKRTKSGRECYGDDAVRYVQVKRENALCTVNARITTERKPRATAYRCTFICDEIKDKIVSVECEGCASRGCKHIGTLVMWLHRRSEEPDIREVVYYWTKPKKSQFGSQLKFITAKDLGKDKTAMDDEDDESTPSTSNETKESFFNAVIQKSIEMGINSPIAAYFRPPTDIDKTSIYYLINQFREERDVKDADSFISYCKDNMRPQQCVAIEEATRTETDCRVRNEMRYARITASKAHQSAQCKIPDEDLVEYLLGAFTFKETLADKRGKGLKNSVLEEVSQIKNIKFQKVGLILCTEYPVLAASPDGIAEDCIIEIKCRDYNKKIKNYLKNGVVAQKYYAQMQIQMLLTRKKKCFFCIAHENFESTKDVDIHEVCYNEDYCEKLIKKCEIFYKKNIFTQLC